MHFNLITTLALIANLATATPTPDQSPNLAKRQERPVWQVKMFTDNLCQHTTGTVSDNHPTCENLSDFAVDIVGIRASVQGTTLNNRCSWTVRAYRDYDCKGANPEYQPVYENVCRTNYGTIEDVPIKSFHVYESGPCE